jgi:hypothetical protein
LQEIPHVGASLLAKAVYQQNSWRLTHRLREQARSHRIYGGFEIRSKTTSTCTESATAERYRYTRLRPALRNALIRLSFSPRPML